MSALLISCFDSWFSVDSFESDGGWTEVGREPLWGSGSQGVFDAPIKSGASGSAVPNVALRIAGSALPT